MTKTKQLAESWQMENFNPSHCHQLPTVIAKRNWVRLIRGALRQQALPDHGLEARLYLVNKFMVLACYCIETISQSLSVNLRQ